MTIRMDYVATEDAEILAIKECVPIRRLWWVLWVSEIARDKPVVNY